MTQCLFLGRQIGDLYVEGILERIRFVHGISGDIQAQPASEPGETVADMPSVRVAS